MCEQSPTPPHRRPFSLSTPLTLLACAVVAICPNDETVRILCTKTWEEKAKLAGVRDPCQAPLRALHSFLSLLSLASLVWRLCNARLLAPPLL